MKIGILMVYVLCIEKDLFQTQNSNPKTEVKNKMSVVGLIQGVVTVFFSLLGLSVIYFHLRIKSLEEKLKPEDGGD